MDPKKLSAAVLALASSFAPPANLFAQVRMTQAPGPATPGPRNGNCGLAPNITTEEAEERVRAVFQSVLNLSGYRPDTRLIFSAERDTQALDPWTDINKSGTPAVVIGYELCDSVHNADELAWSIGHEIAHLAQDHPSRRQRYIYKGFKFWARLNPSSRIPNPLPKTFDGLVRDCPNALEEFMEEYQEPIHDYIATQETQADRISFNYLRRPGSPFQARSGAIGAAIHMRDQDWVEGLDHRAPTTHPAPMQRAYDLEVYAEK